MAMNSSSGSQSFVQRCCIPGCHSNYDRNSELVEVFPLPREQNIRKLWLRYLPPELHYLNPVICAKHFPKNQLVNAGGSAMLVNGEVTVYQKVKLRPNAVPTIFPHYSKVVTMPQEHPYSRNWQGGSVVLAQGGSGVTANPIDMPQNPSIPASLANPAMRAPPIHPGFIPLSDQIRSRSSQFLNMYPTFPPKIMNPPGQGVAPPSLPLYSDVKFKKLPFYDVLGDLLKPTVLATNPAARDPIAHYAFFLNPSQASEVGLNREVGPGTKNEYSVQIQLRFCLLETTPEQDDQFPPGCIAKVNGKAAPLPNPVNTKQGQEPKRPPRPVNISHLVKLCPSVSNNVSVQWTADFQRSYCVAVFLVRKLTSTDLLERLRQKGVRSAEHTAGLIKEKLSDSDNDIATTSLRVSLICPLGKMRMQTPIRSTTCGHFQCFDGAVFLNMNEKRPTWSCPVCNKTANYDDLVIDGYFQEVLDSSILGDSNEIQLNKDGSWSVHNEEEETVAISSSKSHHVAPSDDQIEEIKDDDDDEMNGNVIVNGDSGNKTGENKTGNDGTSKDMVVVDLTESDDEGSAPPPPTTNNNSAPPPSAKLEHAYASGLETTVNSLAPPPVRSSPSIINLDSPSPSPPLPSYGLSAPTNPPTNYMSHLRVDSQYHPF